MTLPARSMRATQPRARNCASIHSARFCSKKVGAGVRQSCKCCSLIHCFSRANHWRASRMGAELTHSVRNVEMGGGAEGGEASLIGAAKCQFSSGWLVGAERPETFRLGLDWRKAPCFTKGVA